jgi:hypothetical protein
MVKQWKKGAPADELLKRLIAEREIPLDWKNENDTKDYWSKHPVFKFYSHPVFTAYTLKVGT